MTQTKQDDPASRGEEGEFARGGGGESGGGASPEPGPKPEPHQEGFLGHGGQSEIAYHGKGQLGEEKVGENANAPAEED